MSLALAIMILLITAIIAALALFLTATIVQLIKINKGLAIVIGGVGEIVQKTAPVNGVLDAINGNLVAGRNLLENLFIKKAGDDAGGLVESLFPGEGAEVPAACRSSRPGRQHRHRVHAWHGHPGVPGSWSADRRRPRQGPRGA